MESSFPWLTLLTFSPIIGLLVLLFIPGTNSRALRTAAIVTTLVPLGLSLWLFASYDAANPNAFREQVDWITIALNHEAVNIGSSAYVFQYHLAVDGLSLPLVALAALVAVMAALASVHIKKRWKAFYVWFLLLETGMLGVFLACAERFGFGLRRNAITQTMKMSPI